MASAQPEIQYLFGSSECHKKYMAFIGKAVESAVGGEQGRRKGHKTGGENSRKEDGKNITLYVASAPKLHFRTVWEIISKIKDVSNLQVKYYFRDTDYKKLLDPAKKSRKNETAAQKERRLIVEGTAEERELMKSYFNENKNQELRLSSSKKKQYFHTKWAAFHDDHHDQLQLLLTSAILIYDHMKDQDSGTKIINSLIERQLSHASFLKQFVEPMNTVTYDGHADQDENDEPDETTDGEDSGNTDENVRDGKTSDGGDRSSPQQGGNYSNVKIYKEVQRFVAEAVNHCAQHHQDTSEKAELHVVSAFFADEVILKSVLDQTQQARKDNHLRMSIVFKDENDYAKGLKKLNEDTKELGNTQDWTTGVEIIRAKDFHHKFLGYGPVVGQDQEEETFQVLMMSANVDTKHISVNENPSHHNLDWVTKIPVEKQDYVNMLTILPRITDTQLGNSKKKFDAMNCISLDDLVKRCEAVSVDLSKNLQELKL